MAESHGQLQELPIGKALRNVFTDGDYSDLQITCKDRIWNVHKLVVCTQSDFFKKACEGSFAEAWESKISLPDDNPEVVEVMLHYFYHFDYDDEKERGMAPLLLNLHVFEIADKYFIHPLKDVATEKFNCRAYHDWGSEDFADALEKLYESSYAGGPIEVLRLICLEVVKEHDKTLFHDDAYSRFQVAAISSPAFMFEYIRSMTAEPRTRSIITRTFDLNWYKCPGSQCRAHGVVFGVRNTVSPKFQFTCPLRCSGNRSQEFWSMFQTTV